MISLAVLAMSQFGSVQKPAEFPIPKVSSGTIQRLAAFPSKFIEARNVDVWLPPKFEKGKKYPVLYMHDGQMLFDATITWNKQAWEMDEVLGKLIEQKAVPEVILVGVFNSPKRHPEYFPQKAFLNLPPADGTKALKALNIEQLEADNYLKFLVEELKPYIDSHFPTKRGPGDTTIMGSSMGGLISMYAMCEYPKVFGKAGCISTHWPGGFPGNPMVNSGAIGNAILKYLSEHLPPSKGHRIYFDRGDKTLDEYYKPWQDKVDQIMKEKGWNAKNCLSRAFPGADHSEKSWNARVAIPLQFLLK